MRRNSIASAVYFTHRVYSEGLGNHPRVVHNFNLLRRTVRVLAIFHRTTRFWPSLGISPALVSGVLGDDDGTSG